MMPKKNKIILALGLILALSLFLRIWKLSSLPQGVDWDEASYGYNAYSILKTGRDEWGKFLPLTFRAFGDSKQPLLVYLNIPFIALFGLNLFSVRIVSALAGTVSVALIFLIGRKLFRNDAVALTSAFLAALSPYGIFYSRIGIEISLWGMLTLAIIYCELKYAKDNNARYWIAVSVLSILLFFTHNAAKIMAPALLFTLSSINALFLKKPARSMIFPLAVAILFVFTLYIQSKQSWNARMQFVGIFGQGKSVALEIGQFREDDKNNLVSKALHNKGSFLAMRLAKNYLSHFTYNYLINFSKPEIVQVSYHGPLYLAEILFYYLGLILVLGNVLKKRGGMLSLFPILIAWILIAPLPSFITEGGIDKRYIGAFGTWEILSAYGFWHAASELKSAKIKTLPILFASALLIALIAESAFFLQSYFVVIPNDYGKLYFARQKQIGILAKEMYGNSNAVTVSNALTGETQIFPLFYMQFPPAQYTATKQWNGSSDGWANVTGFGKFTFTDNLNLAAVEPQLHRKTVGYIIAGKDLYRNRNLDYLSRRKIGISGYRKETWDPDAVYSFSVRYD